MRRTVRNFSTAVILIGVFLSASVVQAEAPLRQTLTGLSGSVVRDVNGNPLSFASNPGTLLYTTALGTPLLAPDGHHLTWGEWIRPAILETSIVSMKCINKGTHITFELNGLVPEALYSIWLLVQPSPGAPALSAALPSIVAGDTYFTTDENGTASVNAIVPAGPFATGEIPACLLDTQAIFFQLVYHSDGQLYGDVPGPDGISLNHISFFLAP